MQIAIFKTNLTNVNRINDVESYLETHPSIIKWNVDLNDEDNILRIVSHNVDGKEIENLLLQAGYFCEEIE